MTKPTKPTVPPAPLRSQPQTFSANAETFLAFWPTFATYLDDVGAFTNERANAALAAAIGGDLPPLTGQALRYLRVNASETAAEFFNPLFSPALTGTPTAPTAAAGTNTTQIATTAYTRTAIPNVLNASGLAPVYACRAWVNFNGNGTLAILESGNVSSVTDNGVGDYTVNFATAMATANFACIAIASASSTLNIPGGIVQSAGVSNGDFTRTTSSIRLRNARSGNGDSADAFINVAIFA